MKNKVQLIAWIAFIVIVGGAIVYALQNDIQEGPVNEMAAQPQKVEILKYSDYSCPACKHYIQFQEQLKRDFGDNISIEYRHFPLGSFQHSELAARAVEAAAEQGRKNDMHDKVFEGQQVWSGGDAEEIFLSYAEELDLDIGQFQSDIQSEEIGERIRRQRAEGERRMVRSTPTFFVNGQRIQQNPENYNQFKSLVEMHMYRQ